MWNKMFLKYLWMKTFSQYVFNCIRGLNMWWTKHRHNMNIHLYIYMNIIKYETLPVEHCQNITHSCQDRIICFDYLEKLIVGCHLTVVCTHNKKDESYVIRWFAKPHQATIVLDGRHCLSSTAKQAHSLCKALYYVNIT